MNRAMYKPSPKKLMVFILIVALIAFLSTCPAIKFKCLILLVFLIFTLARTVNFGSWNLGRTRENLLYQILLAKRRGDRNQVERLVDYERQCSPRSSRTELLQTAIYRWERDRR